MRYNLLIALFFLYAPHLSAQSPPNILLFLVDDMGWQDTSVPFWEQVTPFNKRYRTPNMEKLAAQGMKFTNAYATPVCSPTRVSLFTGMNAARHRVTNWTLRLNQATDSPDDQLDIPNWNVNGMQPQAGISRSVHATPLAQLLQDAGYFTIHCGKAHFGAMETPGSEPKNLGFDVNIAGHAAGGPGSHLGTKNFGNAAAGVNTTPWGVPGLEPYHGQDIFLTEALTKEAIKALDQRGKQPFFLYMSHYTVHVPIEPDNRFLQPYLGAGLDEREAKYAAMVEGMDKSLGDLLKYLEKQALSENTIILFMSDNGGYSLTPGRGGEAFTHNLPLRSGKGSAYEGGIREPMLVKWPGVTKAGSTCSAPLIIEDFFPTILEMAGNPNPKTVQTIDGQSFVPLLKGKPTKSSKRSFIWHYPHRWIPQEYPGITLFSSIRQGDWKLIYYYKTQSVELFNLKEDIGEQYNLATAQPKLARKMQQRLRKQLLSRNAQFPTDKRSGQQVMP